MKPHAAPLLLALLAGCAVQRAAPPPAAPPPPPAAALDVTYDWHVLLTAAFGATVKDVPFKLHEVLVFNDAQEHAGTREAECYGIDGAAPRFMTRTPDSYLLCFRHDHLARIESTVLLPKAEADRLVADACDLWRKNAEQQPSAPQATATEAGSDAAAPACAGRDRGIDYWARAEQDADEDQVPFTVKLDGPEPAIP